MQAWASRCGLNVSGYPYHVLIRGNGRMTILEGDGDRAAFN